ncbi:MAG TPA: hypothetical protein VGC19_06000 [Rhodanobacter sp.]
MYSVAEHEEFPSIERVNIRNVDALKSAAKSYNELLVETRGYVDWSSDGTMAYLASTLNDRLDVVFKEYNKFKSDVFNDGITLRADEWKKSSDMANFSKLVESQEKKIGSKSRSDGRKIVRKFNEEFLNNFFLGTILVPSKKFEGHERGVYLTKSLSKKASSSMGIKDGLDKAFGKVPLASGALKTISQATKIKDDEGGMLNPAAFINAMNGLYEMGKSIDETINGACEKDKPGTLPDFVIGLVAGFGESATDLAEAAHGLMDFAKEVGSEAVKENLKTAIPIMGAVLSGINMGKAGYYFGKVVVKKVKLKTSEESFRHGDTKGALRSINTLVNRDLKTKGAKLGTSVLSFSTSVATTVHPAAHAANFASAAVATLTDVALEMYAHYINAKDLKRGNEALHKGTASGSFDVTVFNSCPLLGCYFIHYAPTSLCLDFLSMSDHGKYDTNGNGYFNDKYMKMLTSMSKDISKVKKIARKYISDAPLQLTTTNKPHKNNVSYGDLRSQFVQDISERVTKGL